MVKVNSRVFLVGSKQNPEFFRPKYEQRGDRDAFPLITTSVFGKRSNVKVSRSHIAVPVYNDGMVVEAHDTPCPFATLGI